MTSSTVLIIEDNPITRQLLRVTLEQEGHTVLEAPDGRTGVELMRQGPPDLVVQDLVLPDIDGFTLVQQLRSLPGGSAVPILAHSGFLSKMEQARSLHLGFTDFLFKPIEPSRLIDLIQVYLPPAVKADQKSGGGCRILVVDDNPVQLKLLKTLLGQAGFVVSSAEDGVSALEQALRSPPDAIVSDVLMPRMDGFRLSLSVRLHPQLAGTRVVLISAAYTDEADQQLAVAAGASALIQCNPSCQEIIDALMEALRKPPPPLPPRPLELTEEYVYRVIRQLERQAALNANLTRRLAMREAELAILAGFPESLANTTAVEDVLDALLYRCVDAAGVSRGAAYLEEPDGRLALKAQVGFADSSRALAEFFGCEQILRQTLETGELVEISHRDDPDAAGLLEQAGVQTLLIAPLTAGERRLGVIVLACPNGNLEHDWRPFAKAVGAQIGQTLTLARTLCRLQEKEEKLERILATIADGLAVTDQHGRITFANQAAERILGMPAAEITGRMYNDPVWNATTVDGRPFPDEEYPFVRVMATGAPVYGVEQVLTRPDGGCIVASINAAPLRDATGNIVGTLRSLRDITRRRQAEQALVRQAEELARYNAELEQFAYVAAHDLQEPLRTVASFTQLLAQRYKDKLDSTAGMFIEQAVKGALRMRHLIDDLLTYSQVARRQADLQPTECDAVFQQSIENLRAAVEESGASITRDPLPKVMADPTRLGQVFQNLIGNAIKFHSERPPQVHVTAEQTGGEWLFSVRDNGIGIDPQHTDRIFQIFERLHGKNEYPGTGIGLALCKRIIERHRGRIWVESKPGEGSTFHFTLPATA